MVLNNREQTLESTNDKNDKGSMIPSKLALAFVLGGKSTFTLRSMRTGNRFTYKVCEVESQNHSKKVYLVKVLTGSDNDNSYSYIGMIEEYNRVCKPLFRQTAKSKMSPSALPVVAIRWTLEKLVSSNGQEMPKNLEIWHSGKCGRCGRKLTVPESIESGFGPECITKIGGGY